MNNFFRTAALVVFSFQVATAQDIRLGVKGTLNLTNIPNFTVIESLGQDLKYMATGGAGVFAELPLDQNFSLRTEAAYNRRGGKIDRLNLGSGTIGSIIGGLTNARLNLDYIDITPLLQYKFTPEAAGTAYIVAGPSVGFLVDNSMSNNFLGFTINYNLHLNYKKADFGGVIGLGYEMPVRGKIKGFVEATYRHGFTNTIDNVAGILKVDSKTSNIGFSAGLSMPLGR